MLLSLAAIQYVAVAIIQPRGLSRHTADGWIRRGVLGGEGVGELGSWGAGRSVVPGPGFGYQKSTDLGRAVGSFLKGRLGGSCCKIKSTLQSRPRAYVCLQVESGRDGRGRVLVVQDGASSAWAMDREGGWQGSVRLWWARAL